MRRRAAAYIRNAFACGAARAGVAPLSALPVSDAQPAERTLPPVDAAERARVQQYVT